MKSTIVAAIDIGSNTVHLTVMRIKRGRPMEHLLSMTRILRLGRIVQKSRGFSPQTLRLIREALKDFVRCAKNEKAHPILIGATAAMRAAPGGRRTLEALSKEIGVRIRLLASGQECRLGFEGARSALPAAGRFLFVDSGGGSTELTLARGRRRVKAVSIPIGSAQLSAGLRGDPPGPLEMAQLMVPIHEALRAAPDDFAPQKAIFTGGTAHHLGILAGAAAGRLTHADINRALRRLLRRPAKKLAKKFKVPLERVSMLATGGFILGSILHHYGLQDAAVTHQGVRDGMVLAYLAKGEKWWK